MEGYVKLYRKLLDNPVICRDSDHLAVWIYLLLHATHKEIPAWFNGEKVLLKPGQLIKGRKVIAKDLSVSESKVQRILACYESEHQIEQQASNKNRLISIVRWSEYQISEQQNEQPANNQRTTTEHPVNTNKNVKNDKNEKMKESIAPLSPLEIAIDEFKQFRAKVKKPMTDHAVDLLRGKLTKLAGDDATHKIAILEQSIFKGWTDVYALKDDFQSAQPATTGKPKTGHFETKPGAYGVPEEMWVEDE